LYTFQAGVRFFIDFDVLALPGSSRAHHDVRLEQSVPTAPISSSVINLMLFIYIVKGFIVEQTRFLLARGRRVSHAQHAPSTQDAAARATIQITQGGLSKAMQIH
jgi:hypothetical protein